MATKKTAASSNLIAVIELMGKQFIVKEGDQLKSEKVLAPEGDSLTVEEVLLVHDGNETKVGTPYVAGAAVTLKHDSLVKDEKIEIRKYKSKSRYRRSTGHRQTLSHLTVTGITLK